MASNTTLLCATEATGSAIDGKEVTVHEEYSVLYDLGDSFENWFVNISPNRISIDCMNAKRRKISLESKTCSFKLDLHTYPRCGYNMNEYTFTGDKGKILLYTHIPYEDSDNENDGVDFKDMKVEGSIDLESEDIDVRMNIPFEIAYMAQMIASGSKRDELESYVEESDTLYKLR
jgi:hypothetical protein